MLLDILFPPWCIAPFKLGVGGGGGKQIVNTSVTLPHELGLLFVCLTIHCSLPRRAKGAQHAT